MSSFLDFAEEDDGGLDALVASTISTSVSKLSACSKKRTYEEVKNPFDSDSDSEAENNHGVVNEILSSGEEDNRKNEDESDDEEIQLLSSKEISDMKATSVLDLDNAGSSQKEDLDEEAALGDAELNRILGNMERTAKDGAGVPLVKSPSDLQAKLFPHQVVGLSWLYSHEYHNQGGMLCDDQGLGKTVEVISLMLKNPPSKFWKKDKGKELLQDYITRPTRTLIIVPLSTLRQWEAEIKKFSGGKLKTALHYGKERVKSREDWGDADVILSTYGTMSAEIKIPEEAVDTNGKPLHNNAQLDTGRQKEDETGAQRVSRDWMEDSDSLLLAEEWYRIVCDESHIMKNYKTRTWLTASCLNAVNRWCLTGTPIHNSMDELYAQLAFVCVPEVENFAQWRKQISIPIQDAARIPKINPDPRMSIMLGRKGRKKKKTVKEIQESAKEAWEFLAEIVNKHILRRTKLTRNKEGLPLVPLPKRTTKIKMVPFSEQETYEYHALYKGAKIRFTQFLLTKEENKGQSNFIHMLVLVTRLRQFCDHPAIVTAAYHMTGDPMEKLLNAQAKRVRDDISLGSEDTDTEDETYERDNAGSSEEEAEDPAKRYSFKESLRKIIEDYVNDYNSNDPRELEEEMSNSPKELKVKAEKEKVKAEVKGEKAKDEVERKVLTYDPKKEPKVWPSSKMTALFEDLIALRHSNPRFKALVFSQFTTFLDIINDSLLELGFELVRLDGRMNQDERNVSIKRFTEEPNVQIFLISLRSGGLGLNLVAASHIFMTDFWWNPALEDQAIDRVHRIGQCAPVHVTRYCTYSAAAIEVADVVPGMDQSLEVQMLDMQEKKRSLSNGTFNEESQQTKTLSVKDVMNIFGITEDSMAKLRRKKKRNQKKLKRLFKVPRKIRRLDSTEEETQEEKRKRLKREELEKKLEQESEAMESWESFQDSTTQALIQVYNGERLASGTRVSCQQPKLRDLCSAYVIENGDIIEDFDAVASKHSPDLVKRVLDELASIRETTDDYLMSNHSKCSVLTVSGSKRGPSPSCLEFVPKLSNVEYLRIGSIHDLKEERLIQIVELMPQLVELVLPNNGNGVTNAVVKQISSLSRLTHLNLTCAYMVTTFDPLFSMWSILELVLNHCPEARITNDDFSSLSWNAAPNLQVLELSNCINLESTLSESAELGTIILESCSKGTVLFELFKVCTNLRRLNLAGQDRFMLNDKTLKSICVLMHLEHIDLSDCGAVYYYDWFLRYMCTKLCKLKVLKLAFAQEAVEEKEKPPVDPVEAVRNPESEEARKQKEAAAKEAREKEAAEKEKRVQEGLGFICLLSDLEELDLRGWTSLDDKGLQKIISGCKKLKKLNLSGCSKLTVASMKLIASAQDLESLNLSWCALNDDVAALLLTSLPNLTTFKLWACNKVSAIKLREEVKKVKLKGRDPEVWA